MSRSREDPVAAELAVVGYDPRQYLQEYFLQLNEEYEGLYRFWCSAVAGLPAGGRALELGVGPTLYSAICLAERFSEIHLADFVDKSLVEIRRWLEREPGSFDWGPHVRLVLRTEGRAGTSEEVAAREARLRSTITRLLLCDLRRLPPLNDPLPYDLVSAHYCTEAAAADTGEWAMTVANAGSLVRPGGCFLLSVSTGLTLCRVYDSEPPHASPAVGEELLREALAGADMDMDSAVIEFLKAPAGRPYRGTFLASVTKRS